MDAAEAKAYSANVLRVFGYNVRRVREKRQYSFSDVEKRSGYGRQYISALELGEKDIQLSTAIRIARALDVPLAKLFMRALDGDAAVLHEAFFELHPARMKNVPRARERVAPPRPPDGDFYHDSLRRKQKPAMQKHCRQGGRSERI